MKGIEFIAGAGAGAAAAAFANQAIKTGFPTAPAWLPGAGMAAAAAGAAILMKNQTPLIMGLEAGFGGMGIAFLMNETVISLPGISGMPAPAPMAPGGGGYMTRTVNGYMRNLPPRVMGNFSNGGAKTVNGLFTN